MDYVQYESRDRIGYITMNRPKKRNALSDSLVRQLKENISRAEKDDNVKVIVLQAKGETFCSGADLAFLQEMQQFSLEQNLSDSEHLKELYYQIYTLKKVVIASVQGSAVAGGCGLASICDFSFAVPGAQFGYPEVKIGFVPALVMVFLVRKIGEGRARQLLLDGSLISADEARNMGLINYVVSPDTLEAKVDEFAQKLIAGNSSNSMMITKQMLAQVQSFSLESALGYAAEMNAKARTSDDCRKGISAFLKKEKILW
jgi:methylglutaconyl-CoA hydratase